MNFEDTQLPPTTLLRAAFNAMGTSIAVDMGTPRTRELAGKSDPMRTPVEAAEVLAETVPSASEGQVAATLLFRTFSFMDSFMLQETLGRHMEDENSSDPYSMYGRRRGPPPMPPEVAKEMPTVLSLSDEWAKVSGRQIATADASTELKQIITALTIADLQKMAADVDTIAADWALKSIESIDQQVKEMGDAKAPALMVKYEQTREETKKILQAKPPAARR